MLDRFIALDLETTGLYPKTDRIIEIGAAKYVKGELVEELSTFVNPQMEIGRTAIEITGITNEMVKSAPVLSAVLPKLLHFTENYPLLGHNIMFDYSFIKKAAQNAGYSFEREGMDTYKLAREFYPQIEGKSLEHLCECFNITVLPRHRALSDAKAAALLYLRIAQDFGAEESLGKTEPLLYRIKKESPVTEKQKQYLGSLRIKLGVKNAPEIESLTRSEASREIDYILSELKQVNSRH